jgi:hypothetical protein
MIKREPLMTEEHFDRLINSRTDRLIEMEDGLKSNPGQYVKIQRVYATLSIYYQTIAFTKYSRGYDVADIKDDLTNAIKWFVTYEQHPDHDTFRFDLLDYYTDTLRLYALGVLLKVDNTLLSDFLSVVKNEGEDALFDTLARFTQPGRQVGNKLLFTATYQLLWTVVQSADPAEQVINMQKFLKGWYKSMRKISWHDHHLSVGKDGFSGYWCWEAALVTALYNIDDSSYRDMPFYPKDLADYARHKN